MTYTSVPPEHRAPHGILAVPDAMPTRAHRGRWLMATGREIHVREMHVGHLANALKTLAARHRARLAAEVTSGRLSLYYAPRGCFTPGVVLGRSDPNTLDFLVRRAPIGRRLLDEWGRRQRHSANSNPPLPHWSQVDVPPLPYPLKKTRPL